MAILSPSFVLGVVVLFYLLSFVLFAIIRIATGISIQRIGYLSLKHIAYTAREGLRIDIRWFGLRLHHPTFARPTWISLRLTEVKLTVDLKALSGSKSSSKNSHLPNDDRKPGFATDKNTDSFKPPLLRRSSSGLPRSRTWRKLTEVKEKIKKLHEKINWLRLVDVEFVNASCLVVDVATVQIGTVTVAVDTRRNAIDKGRMFRHKRVSAAAQQHAEWIFVVKGVLLTPEGQDSRELLDICSLNVHGLLYKDLAGLREASIALKLGRVVLPYDILMACKKRADFLTSKERISLNLYESDVTFSDMIEELNVPGSREGKIVQTVSDSKEFVSSLLRGIEEIQLAVSFIGMSKAVHTIQPSGRPLSLTFAMNEFGIDLFRLDPKSPAHRMYFSPEDTAHQALLAAISIAISVDDGGGKPDRLLYVPMATTTVKTTLPSKTISDSGDENLAQRNANMLFANFVVTSPSIDLDLKHMPIVLALLHNRKAAVDSSKLPKPQPPTQKHHLISRLLPKANIKFSIQEPVARVVIPASDRSLRDGDNYDMVISSLSSISLDMESSHSSIGKLHYAVNSSLRISSQRLYYQAASGARHNIVLADALELKVQISATPEVYVTASGNLQTFSIHLVRPEIAKGVHQIMHQLRKGTQIDDSTKAVTSAKTSVLRRLPSWLVQVSIQGSNFGVEIGGIDSGVSKDTRGVALQLESWNAEYKVQRAIPIDRRPPSHRAGMNNSASGDEFFLKVTPPSPPSKVEPKPDTTDGRRLAIHVQGLEGFVLEGIDAWEPDSFVSVPRFEVALSTASDSRGSIFHIHSNIKALYIQYSLYRYYAIGVAQKVLRRAFSSSIVEATSETSDEKDGSQKHITAAMQHEKPELIVIDVKTHLLQVKATMPHDPPMMLQVYYIEAGRHRWAAPFFKAKLFRLYVQAPKVPSAWARIVSIKAPRVDLRQSRRKVGNLYTTDRSIDVSTDFIRLDIPHQLKLFRVFDNFVNTAKAIEQLHHRFKTETDDYVLKKPPAHARQVPRISIRSKCLVFELEDGSFDWKLGLIYRVGLDEQKQRLAREEAYKVKVKKLQEQAQRRESSRYRVQSVQPKHRGRSKRPEQNNSRPRSLSNGPHVRHRSLSRSGRRRGRHMRYDAEGFGGLSDTAKISADEAWFKLQQHNASSWKKRIAFAIRYQSNAMKDIRGLFWGKDEFLDNMEESEDIIAIPGRPGLMTTLIRDPHIVIDKPSFPIHECSRFLNTAGKGMPVDMKYSLLIPMHVQINMGQARITLRNYPLPLIHIPEIKQGQSSRLPSWSLKTDFVIAEEYRDDESLKHVKVEVIPANKITLPEEVKNGFAIDVRRTVSPVKTYSNIDISINTANHTSITWGTSYQPAIQEMMQVIEGFTKPQFDPSERVGFWDKIRLGFHSRLRVAWKGDGDVHLKLKGSRDPYVVTGHGAGFVMCFRNDVRWDIHQDDDPKKFMTVSCGEYIMAIPDYSSEARQVSHGSGQDSSSVSSASSRKENAMFKKVVMKLSGNVRWLAGLVFERDIEGGGRSFESIPHYNVILKNPHFAKRNNGRPYDAFRGFRSQHIHLSIAVIAPVDRDWSVTNLKPSTSYNSIHLTPRFFTHFFDWWHLFSGVMSLPVRQGKLFPGVEKSSKKFGRHLATIKYNLLLSPLFIAHVYKHKDAEDYAEETVGATGLKLRLDSFMLDLHQRREEFPTQVNSGVKLTKKTSAMKINRAQLDFISADIRAVSASIKGTSAEELKLATEADLASYQEQTIASPDISRFTIPDNDFLWIDMDDFVELDWILPAETHPETKIMPLAFAPRFTYFRQTDHHMSAAGNEGGSSPFGDEPTHFCIMSQDNDPQRIQCDLVKERLARIEEQMVTHQRALGEQELRVVRDGPSDASLHERLEELTRQGKVLEEKKEFMQVMLEHLIQRLDDKTSTSTPSNGQNGSATPLSGKESGSSSNDTPALPSPDSGRDFNNRFTVHNIQLKWNNSLRNIILRYVHQVSQRRGFVYYMSRRAVKFILDIVHEQQRHKERKRESHQQQNRPQAGKSPPTASSKPEDSEFNIEERIAEMLKDGKAFVDAKDSDPKEKKQTHHRHHHHHAATDISHDISEDYTAQNSYHIRLIGPQIQLQSEKNPKSVLLVTAKAMQLKVIQIMDKTRLADDVSGLVQRRFSVDMDDAQFFVTNQKTLMKYIHLYSGNRYGSPKGSAWPPWGPLEVNYDFRLNPFGWYRVVQKTSASLRYDKYNTLRLKYNDGVNKGEGGLATALEDAESRMDHFWVDFPHIRAICDSTQYYAMYVIVLDLLLYSEPLEKKRSERLEKIMLAADFSDLTGAPEMVVALQERIRQLEEIKGHFQLHAKYLDRQGWHDRLAIEKDLTSCEDELFFMMKAITTSQRKNDERSDTSRSNGILRWNLKASEIVWHLMRDKDEALMEFQLQRATYDRTDNSDGSNYNTMEIERIRGLNLLSNALYPEMIAPYFDKQHAADTNTEDIRMFKVQWYMLEAIAGIPVLDQFEVNLFPLKIQLEREVGKKLFEYIFPGDNDETSASPLADKKGLPLNEGENSDDEINGLKNSPTLGESRTSTRPGSIELRLKPTLNLPDTASGKPKHGNRVGADGEVHRFKLFQHTNSSRAIPLTKSSSKAPSIHSISRKKSGDSLATTLPRDTSASNLSIAGGSKRFGIHRTTSKDGDKPSDDLTEMMSRASNYMTLAHVMIPSVVLCLSYKGKGERNIEDVHDFVFRMPALVYRNKTWSNLDLALRLKKDVIRALISHTGAIIGNKFSHHRPNKVQQSRLREMANSSSLLQNSDGSANPLSRTTTTLHRKDQAESPTTSSFISSWSTQIGRTNSDASSFDSLVSPRNYNGLHRVSSSSAVGAQRSSPDLSAASTPFPKSESASEAASIAESEEVEDASETPIELNHGRFKNIPFGRRLTGDTQKMKEKDSHGSSIKDGTGEPEEKSRKHTVINLGKKILHTLN